MMNLNSEPILTGFDPRIIPYQAQVIKDVKQNFDYSLGTHEVLLSGSIGSAKSVLMAHLAVIHCMKNNKARVLIGRRSLPDLKSTIYQKIIEHISCLEEGVHYKKNDTSGHIKFRNGSEIISRSWADKRYKKMRSLELSSAFIEELSENNEDDKEAYEEIKMRIGRLPNIKEKILMCASNPDAPSHWIYKKFFVEKKENKHVYFSRTEDNPFLEDSYIQNLKETLDPKLARRMIYGEWIEISQDVIYYAYNRDNNFKNETYKVNPNFPIYLTWDFNIGLDKPMSMCCLQYINNHIHIFKDIVIHGSRTLDTCEALLDSGVLQQSKEFVICGDASGSNNDTRSLVSDWIIIKKFLESHGVNYISKVPRANPPIRRRHNLVNAYCKNEAGQVRLTVYKDAPTVDEGLRLTAFKKGTNLIEDDSKPYQHVTTALGYALVQIENSKTRVQITSEVR